MPSETDSSESEYDDCEIKLDTHIFTKLTDVVREQYFKFLQKQLEENVRTWQAQYEPDKLQERNSIETSVNECAKSLEDLAIKEATLTQLYQREMIKMIAVIKQSTKDKVLVEQLAEFLKSNEQSRTNSISTQTTQTVYYATKAIQTEELEHVLPALTLDERIDLFQTQLKKGQIDGVRHLDKPKHHKSYVHIEKPCSKRRRLSWQHRQNHSRVSTSASPAPLVLHSPTPPPPPKSLPINLSKVQDWDNFDIQLEGDEIAQELEKIFTEQETNLDEIFGIVSQATTNCDTALEAKSQVTPKQCIEIPQLKSIEKAPTTECVASSSNEQLFPPPVKDLRYSLWPCECFMQRQFLSATLNRLIEEDIRWHDILKWQFSVLFGDEGIDDDFAPCSPSIEMDEVLKSSCMRRISPWVVRHLMKPLNDGLIGNRFLFKKLAKKLAYHIIMENQYPDESVIKNAIENFFCIHSVMTAQDLDNIKMVSIVSYDD